MQRRTFVQRATWLATGCATVTLTGCGTILHSERVKEHHSRDIDWKIAALDGLGLAFFFVPGVIAFVVDFYTGAIYLPPRQTASDRAGDAESDRLVAWDRIEVESHEMTRQPIERVLSQRLGRACSLLERDIRVSALESGDQIAANRQRHLSDPGYGIPAEVVFAHPARSKKA